MTKTEQNRVLAWRLRDYSALRASPASLGAAVEDAGVQLRLTAKLSNPTFLMSGVRIKSDARWKANCSICATVRGFAG